MALAPAEHAQATLSWCRYNYLSPPLPPSELPQALCYCCVPTMCRAQFISAKERTGLGACTPPPQPPPPFPPRGTTSTGCYCELLLPLVDAGRGSFPRRSARA